MYVHVCTVHVCLYVHVYASHFIFCRGHSSGWNSNQSNFHSPYFSNCDTVHNCHPRHVFGSGVSGVQHCLSQSQVSPYIHVYVHVALTETGRTTFCAYTRTCSWSIFVISITLCISFYLTICFDPLHTACMVL